MDVELSVKFLLMWKLLVTFYHCGHFSLVESFVFSASTTVCPTRYRTRHFFNNSNTNEDIATKFEHEYVRCVRNEEECVCSVCL